MEVDLDAIEFNTQQMVRHIAPAELCAVVKADGYGHGDVPAALAALNGGASWLAVALVEEGVRLREADIDVPILILSEPLTEDLPSVVGHGLTPTVYRHDFVAKLSDAAAESRTEPYPVHLKLDTGMHRVGAPVNVALEVARAIDRDPRLALQGVFTHFSVADEDVEYTRHQNAALVQFVEALADEGIHPRIVHAANTAAALELPEARHQMCRVGLGVYGLRPMPARGDSVSLRPAMRVVSRVRYLRSVPAGARPSYGRIREIERPGSIATVPIGYADGVPRRLAAAGSVLINGKHYNFAGQITMDMVVVDVGDDDVAVGDEVVLLGVQGAEEISAEAWAETLGTINYEIVCDFGPRLPRRYTRGGSPDG